MKTDSDMLVTEVRIPPVEPGAWTDAMREVFAINEGPEARETGSRYNVINLLAHHPALAVPWLTYNRVLLRETSLPDRLREIVILRVAWRHRSEYEWVQHVLLGRRVGLTDEDIEAVKSGAEAPWSELERLALCAVDQLCDRSQVDKATWDGLATHLDTRGLLELMFMIGTYVMLALIFNAVGLQLEPASAP